MPDLFPYQAIGADFLASKNFALLADEMGLGKSAQAITACDHLAAKRILVICPAVARANWQNEFALFSNVGHRTYVAYSAKDIVIPDEGVLIVSYDLVERAYDLLTSTKWDVCIADEAHFLKNRKAKRTRAIYGEFAKIPGLIKSVRNFWSLTGTPAPNDYTELWPMLFAFKATNLKYWDFLDRYTVWRETPFGTQIIKGKNHAELKDILTKVMIRRKKEDVMTELPPIFFSDVIVEPGAFDEELYFYDGTGELDPRLPEMLKKQLHHAEFMIEQMGTGTPGLDALAAAQQSMSTLRRYIGLQKVAPVVSMVNDMIEGGVDKIVLFCVHKDVINSLERELKHHHAVTLYGGTPAAKRQNRVTRFQNDKACKVFIGQVQAAGTAITLTASHHVLFVESSWVPAENAQASMRCHRIGQTKPVNVQFVSIANSIDQRIQRALMRKTKDLADLFE